MARILTPKRVIKGTAKGPCQNCHEDTELEFELEQSKILENQNFVRDIVRKEVEHATTCASCGRKLWQSAGPGCKNC